MGLSLPLLYLGRPYQSGHCWGSLPKHHNKAERDVRRARFTIRNQPRQRQEERWEPPRRWEYLAVRRCCWSDGVGIGIVNNSVGLQF